MLQKFLFQTGKPWEDQPRKVLNLHSMYDRCAIYYDTPLRDRFSKQCFKLSHKVFCGRKFATDSKVVDLGCGSGLLSQMLQSQGYQVTGVDLSDEMLRLGRQRKTDHDELPEYLKHDIRTFCRPGHFHGALCFGDVLNHLLEIEDIEQLFESVYKSLTPGGVFLADTTTIDAYRSDLWKADGHTDERDGATIRLSSGFKIEENLGWIEILVEENGLTTTEKTFQRYHPETKIEELLKKVGFSQVIRSDFNPLPELFDLGAIKNVWMSIK